MSQSLIHFVHRPVRAWFVLQLCIKILNHGISACVTVGVVGDVAGDVHFLSVSIAHVYAQDKTLFINLHFIAHVRIVCICSLCSRLVKYRSEDDRAFLATSVLFKNKMRHLSCVVIWAIKWIPIVST